MTRNSQNSHTLSDGIAAQEIASVERDLRKSTTESVDVLLVPTGGRIHFRTLTPNETFRASITGSLVTAITETDEWAVDRILDPLEDTDDGTIETAVGIRLTE